MSLTGKIAILGFGQEGFSSYMYLKKHGISDITILDSRVFEDFSLDEQAILIKEESILGSNYLDTLHIFDKIIKTPGISPYHEKIEPYRYKLTSQAQIFFDEFPGSIIAVTGTKGKSTTTSLIYSILKTADFNVGIIGNIGTPVLDSLDQGYTHVVFEISSYMLDGISIDPYISVLINIYREHLDYHRGYDNYQKAKLSIIGVHSIVVTSDELRHLVENYSNKKIYCGKDSDYMLQGGYFCNGDKKITKRSELSLIGEHNEQNMLYAIAVAQTIGISDDLIKKGLRDFRGLPHRLEYVGEKYGITFYDDAISTTPESTLAALRALRDIDTIFLGGSDRGYDFHELLEYLIDSEVHNIIFFPETGIRMYKEIEETEKYTERRFNIFHTSSMREAVEFAFGNTAKGKICLLSCASPSYSLWKNFEVKGDEFQKYVKKYTK